MSEYRLTVVRVDANPVYEPENAYESMRRRHEGIAYGEQYNIPQRVEVGTLSVELTEPEWQAVKRAVLEHATLAGISKAARS